MSAERVWRERGQAGMLAVGVTVLQLGAALTDPSGGELRALDLGLILVAGLALGFSRRAPAAVLLLVSGCMGAYELRGAPGDVLAFPVMAAVYAAARQSRRLVLLAPVLALATAITGDLLPGEGGSVYGAFQARFLLAGWIVAAAMVGQAASNWEAYLGQVEQRAAEAERSREEAALRRAGEERLRIARELHDSLTHSISVIKVQAGVAVHLARKHGEEVPAALLAIHEASSDASRELRSTLGVLRTADGAEKGAGDISGLGLLDTLVTRAQGAGLAVTLRTEGERRPLPEECDRAAYRIVQEALTNAARHAGGSATARVTVSYDEDALTLRVDDDGRAAPDHPHVPGTGLIGMRERVNALHGLLEAGARSEGGFTVHVRLPAPRRAAGGDAHAPAVRGAPGPDRPSGAAVPDAATPRAPAPDGPAPEAPAAGAAASDTPATREATT